MVQIIGREKCGVKIIKSIHSDKDLDKELAEKNGFQYYESLDKLLEGEDDESKREIDRFSKISIK